jgi:hypothetical protein
MVVRILAGAIASLILAAPLATEPAYSQTNYSASKPRAAVRTNQVQVRTGSKAFDPDPFIQGEICVIVIQVGPTERFSSVLRAQ